MQECLLLEITIFYSASTLECCLTTDTGPNDPHHSIQTHRRPECHVTDTGHDAPHHHSIQKNDKMTPSQYTDT